MATLGVHNQAYTSLIYAGGLPATGLSGNNPIVITYDQDGASTQAGLRGAQTSMSSSESGRMEVKCFAYSPLRQWAKIQLKKQRQGLSTLHDMLLLTAAGETYSLTGGGVVSDGGVTTGGAEGAEHSVIFTFQKIEPFI